jgi:hypothetical protein
MYTIRRFLLSCPILLLALALCGCAPDAMLRPARDAQAPLAEPAFRFDALADLRGRHPVLADDEAFLRWLGLHGISCWHETAADNTDVRTLVVQGGGGERLFAARVRGVGRGTGASLLEFRDVDAVVARRKVQSAIRLFRDKAKQMEIHAVRPVITFLPDGKYQLSWEVEFIEDLVIHTYVTGDETLQLRGSRNIKALPPSGGVRPAAEDDMASNELHHLAIFRAQAEEWTQGATNTQERARRIFANVRSHYRYDGTITHIAEFTWADTLVRDTNGYRGICDEWAVVQISYLRSISIPARLKFLIWSQGGSSVGHACLEYRDGSEWRHLDALWNAFNNKAVYRNSGASNVTVMDADYPLDSRSTQPAWGVPDPTGDGRLYPYGDFIIAPPYPGNSRIGYSW